MKRLTPGPDWLVKRWQAFLAWRRRWMALRLALLLLILLPVAASQLELPSLVDIAIQAIRNGSEPTLAYRTYRFEQDRYLQGLRDRVAKQDPRWAGTTMPLLDREALLAEARAVGLVEAGITWRELNRQARSRAEQQMYWSTSQWAEVDDMFASATAPANLRSAAIWGKGAMGAVFLALRYLLAMASLPVWLIWLPLCVWAAHRVERWSGRRTREMHAVGGVAATLLLLGAYWVYLSFREESLSQAFWWDLPVGIAHLVLWGALLGWWGTALWRRLELHPRPRLILILAVMIINCQAVVLALGGVPSRSCWGRPWYADTYRLGNAATYDALIDTLCSG